METKQCIKCQEVKPLETFPLYKKRSGIRTTRGECRKCYNKRCLGYHWNNKEKNNQRSRNYYMKNYDKIYQVIKKWRDANSDKTRALSKKYREGLRDYYLTSKLRGQGIIVTPETIEIKRLQIQIYRDAHIKN